MATVPEAPSAVVSKEVIPRLSERVCKYIGDLFKPKSKPEVTTAKADG